MSLTSVTRRWNGTTVATVNGVQVELSQSDLAALASGRLPQPAPSPVRPLTITTGDGRLQGADGPVRHGIFWNGTKWVFLDQNCQPIPGLGGWKQTNLNRATFHFNVGA